MVIDGDVTSVYHNTVIQRVAITSGYVAKLAEDRKFLADMTSA
jgi:hypothetical protein